MHCVSSPAPPPLAPSLSWGACCCPIHSTAEGAYCGRCCCASRPLPSTQSSKPWACAPHTHSSGARAAAPACGWRQRCWWQPRRLQAEQGVGASMGACSWSPLKLRQRCLPAECAVHILDAVAARCRRTTTRMNRRTHRVPNSTIPPHHAHAMRHTPHTACVTLPCMCPTHTWLPRQRSLAQL